MKITYRLCPSLENDHLGWFAEFAKVRKRMHSKNVQDFLVALAKIPFGASSEDRSVSDCLDIMDDLEAIDLALINLIYPQVKNIHQLGYLASLQQEHLFDLSYLLDVTGTPDMSLVKQEWRLSDDQVENYLDQWRKSGINPRNLPTFFETDREEKRKELKKNVL